MFQLPEWSMIFAASANGVELGVLGVADPASKFVQMTLADAGRAEMPLVDMRDERYPVGLALSTTAAQVLPDKPKDDPASRYPHSMPVVLMLAGDGMLCGFYAVHKTAGKVTHPPTGAAGQPRPGKIAMQAAPAAAVTAVPPPAATPKTDPVVPSFGGGGLPKINLASTFESMATASTPIKPAAVPAPKLSFGLTPSAVPPAAAPPPPPLEPAKSAFAPPPPPPAAKTMKPPEPPLPVATTSKSNEQVTSKKEVEASYQNAIREEILMFEKQLKEFRQKARTLTVDIGTPDEMMDLKVGFIFEHRNYFFRKSSSMWFLLKEKGVFWIWGIELLSVKHKLLVRLVNPRNQYNFGPTH